jgi:hypothetical protein
MGKDFFVDCLGTVTILTDDLVVFQGQIKHEKRHHDEQPIIVKNEIVGEDEEFIELRLECVPVLLTITGNAVRFVELEIYRVNDVVRINVEQIISIGPSSVGCLVTGAAASS